MDLKENKLTQTKLISELKYWNVILIIDQKRQEKRRK